MTFTVGETVVYPHHGAALIEEIKTRTIRGEPPRPGPGRGAAQSIDGSPC